jgi:biotin carboxyl carrier protein
VGRLLRAAGSARLVAPAGATGFVLPSEHAHAGRRRRAVEHGAPLLRLRASSEAPPPAEEDRGGAAAGHLVRRAPQAGRFYHRPGPDQAAYVHPGDEVGEGSPVGLIEVMKTFFQVRWGDPILGGQLPPQARVVRYLAGDGAEVEQGQPLLELEHVAG